MLFNSIDFAIFFVIVYGLYRVLSFSWQNWMLLFAGYIFYGWWDVRFLFLIAFSTTVDFWIGLMLGEGRVPRRERLTASVFLIGAAVLFLNLNWGAIFRADPARIVSFTHLGIGAIFATLAVAALANATHDRLAVMEQKRRRRLLLMVTVGVNLGFLGIFKYFNFFITSAQATLNAIGWQFDPFLVKVVLPVGISFYTFQSLSYTIDIARGRFKSVRRFWDFALFVAFFPPMVAGPIERARHLLPQLQRPRTIRLNQSFHGIELILLGLFKKVAIADGLAASVNPIFDSPGSVSGQDIALATVLFAFQIFCDFSGYTDIARGVAKLLGIELALNFDLPYFSRNPSEFWRRWHISLSSWLRDYLYISLGGNQKGKWRTYANLMTTMVLGGLWHGASANFIVWGGYQGALLCGYRALTGRGARLPTGLRLEGDAPPHAARRLFDRLTTLATILFFFLFICYGWLLFRAHSLHQILRFSATLAGAGPHVSSVLAQPPLAATVGLLLLLVLQVAEWIDGQRECYRHWPRPMQGLLYATMIFIFFMGTSNVPTQFIYFQF